MAKLTLVASVQRLAARMRQAPDVFFVHLHIAPPAKTSAMAPAERTLGAKLPPDLVSLYTEECASLSFAWSVREGQEYRVRAEEGFRPSGQLDLRAPKELMFWHGTRLAVVFADGTGDGIALDLSDDAEHAFVSFNHDEALGGEPAWADAPAVVEALAKRMFTRGHRDEPVTPTLRRFLAGTGELAKARKVVAQKAPRPVASAKTAAVPDILELTPHKGSVSAIGVIDERRVVSSSWHEKSLLVRDATRLRPLGKLAGAGRAIVLLADRKGRLVSTGRGALERFNVDTGAREVLQKRDPYTVFAEILDDGDLLAMTTAFLEVVRLAPNAPVKRSVEIDGAAFWRRGTSEVVVAGSTPKGRFTLARVDLARGKITTRSEWPIHQNVVGPAGFWGRDLLIALDDGSVVGVHPKTLAPDRALPRKAKQVAGPGARLLDGRTWIVARYTTRAVLDVFDAETRERKRTVEVPGAKGPITALAATAGGRLVVGDHTGWMASLATRLLE
jgi:hypothetical protein